MRVISRTRRADTSSVKNSKITLTSFIHVYSMMAIDYAVSIPASGITYWILPNSRLLQRSHIRWPSTTPSPFSTTFWRTVQPKEPETMGLRSSDGQTFEPLFVR